MAHPNKLRVEKKRESVSQPNTIRNWDSQFLSCSELFFPIMPYGLIFSNFSNWPNLNELNDNKPSGLFSWTGHNILFVLQKGRRSKEGFESLYEPRIFLQGEVRTRLQSWHDFYNSLIWYTFPKIKAALNMRQFISFDEHAVFPWKIPPPARMREQDFMTMFDEGGCILMTSESFSLPFIFGHAVYERMTLGDKNLSMCTVNIKCNDSFFALESKLQNEFIDDNLSKLLSDRRTYNTNTPFYSLSIATALDYYNFYRNKVPLTQN